MKVTINEGLKLIKEKVKKGGFEIVSLEESLNRICAQDLKAKFNLPRFNNSAMDGYAIKLNDAGKKVKVVDTILAGEDKDITLKESQAIKIMTGAKIPKECEAVVPFEDIEIQDDFIILPKNIKKYANVRMAGEDVKKDEEIINDGEKIDPYKIALLASQGYSYIKVYTKPKVAIFATGKELKMHHESIKEHQIYNSNAPMLYTRVKELGCEANLIETSDDDKESIKNIIKNLLKFDLIITSGGVSVGEADFTKKAFLELGAKIVFDKVDIKPGKPTTFATFDNTYVLNLPGNPLAAAINFEIFGRFIINILRGKKEIYQNYIDAILKEDIKNRPKREVAIPGFFDRKYFIPSKKRGPGMVTPLSKANGYIVLYRDVESLKEGSRVKFIPIKFEFTAKEKKDFFTYC